MVAKLATLILALSSIGSVLSQSGCPLSGADEKFLIERRKQALRATLLAQLGLKNTSFPTVTNRTVAKEQLDTYLALSEAAASRQEEKQRQCQSEEIYARPITTIVGTIDNSQHRLGRRYAANENILNTIDLEFDFNLKEGLTSITRGDIILYQDEVSGDAYIKDKVQYVEIKAVFDSISLKTVVAAKNLNVHKKGFQAFDVTSAVKLWAQKQVNGTVRLEVTVSCFSSKTCALGNAKQGSPTPITFDFESEARKPRLVIVSQNPLEATSSNRVRRQTTGGGECNERQSTCCLKKLKLDFAKDLNMGFVILPKDFEANYCEGVCPVTPGGSLMTPELYTFITKLTNHQAASLEPCCAGNTFKPLLIVLPDPTIPGGTITEELQQVTVESCRCA